MQYNYGGNRSLDYRDYIRKILTQIESLLNIIANN